MQCIDIEGPKIDCLSVVMCPLLAQLKTGFFSIFCCGCLQYYEANKASLRQSIILRCLWCSVCHIRYLWSEPPFLKIIREKQNKLFSIRKFDRMVPCRFVENRLADRHVADLTLTPVECQFVAKFFYFTFSTNCHDIWSNGSWSTIIFFRPVGPNGFRRNKAAPRENPMCQNL